MADLTGLYPAPTYPCAEVSDFGRNVRYKTRCSACGKVAFPDEARARSAAEGIGRKRRNGKKPVAMRAYLGHCGHWHLTSQRERQR